MSKKIACLITDQFEDVEYTKPAQALKDAGHQVVTIEKTKDKMVTGKNGNASVKIHKAIDETRPEDYDALFIPGGFSPDKLRADDRFVHFASYFMEQDKPVFAICHGPQLLITAKKLDGRTVTGFKSIAVDLENAGANYQDKEVVVCNNQLVTSRQPDDIPAFNQEMLNILA